MKERWQVTMNQGEIQINSLVQKQCRMTMMFASFMRKTCGTFYQHHINGSFFASETAENDRVQVKLIVFCKLTPRMQ